MNVYGYNLKFKDDLDLLNKILSIYAAIVNLNEGNNHLRPKLVQVISFYILFGYSVDTKNTIMESLNITKKNLNQINSELTRKNYLLRDAFNFRTKHLSKELKEVKSYFLTGNHSKIFLIKLTKSE